MKITFYLISLFLFLLSCTEKEEKKYLTAEVQTITLGKSQRIPLSTIFDSLSYIQLDDKKEDALLKEISKIEIQNNYIYLLDKGSDKLCVFTSDGEFVNRIGNIGQGPGEFVSIADFTIDHATDQIILLDKQSRKINCYDLNGNFQNEIRFTMMARQLVATQNNYVFYTAGSNYYTMLEKKAQPEEKLAYNLFFTDKNGTIRDKFFYYNPLLDDLLGSTVFSYDPQNDRTYFHYAVYDTIYSFSPVGNKKYRIDFGENQLPLEKINKENFSYYLNKTGFAQLMDICCSDRCMFVNYSLNNKVHAFIYKLDTKEVKNISFLENDFDKTSFALAIPEKIIGNKVYFAKSAHTLVENYQSDTVYIHQKGKELCITSESNPVLVIGYLKQNS